MIMAF